MIWVVPLATTELCSRSLTPVLKYFGIRSLIEIPEPKPNGISFRALPPKKINEASPRTISGRTSYHQTRLAFHSLPQLIPRSWTTYGFGPPLAFLQASPWSWQARLASGLFLPINIALLRLGFPTPTCHKHLDKLTKKTRWLVLQKARHHYIK